jgi:hypothetical protein
MNPQSQEAPLPSLEHVRYLHPATSAQYFVANVVGGLLTVYIGKSGCGRNASVALQSKIALRPGGSVSRKMPKLKLVSIDIPEGGNLDILWPGVWCADNNK